jgi:hypothetical protein
MDPVWQGLIRVSQLKQAAKTGQNKDKSHVSYYFSQSSSRAAYCSAYCSAFQT